MSALVVRVAPEPVRSVRDGLRPCAGAASSFALAGGAYDGVGCAAAYDCAVAVGCGGEGGACAGGAFCAGKRRAMRMAASPSLIESDEAVEPLRLCARLRERSTSPWRLLLLGGWSPGRKRTVCVSE